MVYFAVCKHLNLRGFWYHKKKKNTPKQMKEMKMSQIFVCMQISATS